ncbi:polysaccharide deacetylase family protein [Rhizobium sp. RAF56]|uniref:polysaccharide deacetylase family protein n=1 Tax=Rhizobium sp. RAF56 TaxID=3233062 RepID=UPI003F9E751B
MRSELRNRIRRTAISGGLEAASLLSSFGLMRRAGGCGAIFTLHHVRPYAPRPFEPNRHLEITPEFLERAILRLKEEGYVFAALHTLPERIAAKTGERFAAFTLDDGYRDNLKYALPVFARHGVPFTVYVTKGFCERTHSLWWQTLGDLFGHVRRLSFDFGRGEEKIDLSTADRKQRAFKLFAAFVHGTEETQAVSHIDALARRHGIEPLEIVEALVMDRTELQALAAHPLASLGAHGVTHQALSRLDIGKAVAEMAESADYVAGVAGKRPTSICYPYGTPEAAARREAELAADLGFDLAVTTRPGVIAPADQSNLTLLPRLSLNGHYQKPRYVAALGSGIATRLMRRGA